MLTTAEAIIEFLRHIPLMRPSVSAYHRHYFPESISQCVWLYFRFPLSFRDVEENVSRMEARIPLVISVQQSWRFKLEAVLSTGCKISLANQPKGARRP